MDTRVASRYARALFEAAKKADIISSVADDLEGVAHALLNNDGFRRFLESPLRSKADKINLVTTVFGDRVTALTLSAVRLMVEKKREGILLEVREQYLDLKRVHEGRLKVKIMSATPLESGQRDAIVKKIEGATKRTVEAEEILDPKLLAGVKVEYDGYVMDGTVQGNYEKLREQLIFDLLKQS